jgi:putative NADH-flavin reductase
MLNSLVETKYVAIFGGSGKIGKELISVALRNGLKIRALYRPGSEPQEEPPGLEVITGQVTELSDVRKTLEGTSGAIIVFGPRLGKHNDPQPFTADATGKIITEMKKLGISRLIVQTGAIVGGDTPNWSRGVRRIVRGYRKNFPKNAADRDAQERVTKESGLDWTLARPFRISEARGKGKERVRVAQNIHIGMLTSIRKTDLAEFLVEELVGGRFHRQAVYIVN